jgi:hypothetical protein
VGLNLEAAASVLKYVIGIEVGIEKLSHLFYVIK